MAQRENTYDLPGIGLPPVPLNQREATVRLHLPFVFPPGKNAEVILAWLPQRRSSPL